MSDYVNVEKYLENPSFNELLEAMIEWNAREDLYDRYCCVGEYGDGDQSITLMARRKKTEAEIAADKEQEARNRASKQTALAQRTAKLIADLDRKLAELQKEKRQYEAELAVYKEFP